MQQVARKKLAVGNDDQKVLDGELVWAAEDVMLGSKTPEARHAAAIVLRSADTHS